MRFDVITLFPELFQPFMSVGITRRAFESGSLEVHFSNPRDFAQGTYRRVDDRPFGGGPGMVMLAEPLETALLHIRDQRTSQAPVIFFSPQGKHLDHAMVQHWSHSEGAILLCGRYEGIDQRFVDKQVDMHISLGDFVVSGGEIAAITLLDAVARLQPGVLNDQESHQLDSFNPALDGLLDCPHYTRPEAWGDKPIPPVLLSGHHERIEQWRREARLRVTLHLRPDLIVQAREQGRISLVDELFLKQLEA